MPIFPLLTSLESILMIGVTKLDELVIKTSSALNNSFNASKKKSIYGREYMRDMGYKCANYMYSFYFLLLNYQLGVKVILYIPWKIFFLILLEKIQNLPHVQLHD